MHMDFETNFIFFSNSFTTTYLRIIINSNSLRVCHRPRHHLSQILEAST